MYMKVAKPIYCCSGLGTAMLGVKVYFGSKTDRICICSSYEGRGRVGFHISEYGLSN